MSASPQTAGLQQLACNAPGRAIPARACVAPFPCKRRVAWSSFDSQEAWPIFHRPSLHRLNCEYTAKQPSHSNDENSPGSGAAEKETSVNHIDAPEADQEAPGSTDEHGDALLSGADSSSIGLNDGLIDGQLQEHGGGHASAHATEDSGHTIQLHQEATAHSVQLGGEGEGMFETESDIDTDDAGLGADAEGVESVPGGSPEDTEATAEQEDDSEGAESESSGEAGPKERSEDPVQELQGTKIAAAPDLMASRPAMPLAPPESAEGDKSVDPVDYDGEQPPTTASSTDASVSVSTTAADLPALPSALLSPEALPTGASPPEEQPDGRSLSALLPLKPRSQRNKSTSVSVTATPTPDGTMFSFYSAQGSKGLPKSEQAPPALLVDAAAATAPGIEPSPGVPKEDGIPLKAPAATGPSSPGKGASGTKNNLPDQTAPLQGAAPGSEPQDSGTRRVFPSAVPLEAATTDMEFDDGELSGDEEFLLIQMEADDSVDYMTPVDTPAQLQILQEDSRDSSGAPAIAAPEGFFKDVNIQPTGSTDGSAPQVPSSSTAAPGDSLPPLSTDAAAQQTVRPVDNATDTSTAPPEASGGAAAVPIDPAAVDPAVPRRPSKNQHGTGASVGKTRASGTDRNGRYSAMMRGAGSVRPGPVSKGTGKGQGTGKGTGLQRPKVAMPADADPEPPTPSPTHPASEENHVDTKDAPTSPHDPSIAAAAATAAATADPGVVPSVQTAPQNSPPMRPNSNAKLAADVAVERSAGSLSAPSGATGADQPEQSKPSDALAPLSGHSTSATPRPSSVQSQEQPSATGAGATRAEIPPPAAPIYSTTDSGVAHSQPPDPEQVKPTAKAKGSTPGPISSHPLDDIPAAVADKATVALVRQQLGQSRGGNGDGNGRKAGGGGAAATAGAGAAVAGSSTSGNIPVETPPTVSAPSDSVSTGGIPVMPTRVRDSKRAGTRSDRHPPTDAASAIAIAALAGAATGIPPSGLAKGVRARRRRRVDEQNVGTSTAALSPPAEALDGRDNMNSIDPDDAGRDFKPPATPALAPPSAPQNVATSSSKPEPLLSGPPLDEPPETLIHPFHLTLFAVLLIGAVAFAITVINFTTDMGWLWSAVKVFRKLAKSLAFRQSIALMVAIAFVRYGLEPLVRSVRSVFSLPGPWERSTEYFILKQVYQPLEFLLFVAAISTVVEAVLPPLVAVQKETVRIVVRTMLSLTYVIASAFVVFNIKARIVQEKRWRAELSGDTAAQRSLEATNKLLTVLFLFVATLLGLQAIGLDIQSVLAISGFGGLALGLAGREILENVFNGLLIVSSRSFVVGEEIMFTQSGHAGRIIEGIIMDIGWYRTLIRSFEREVYIVPNSVFSRTVVLNVTRKGKEWRVFENIGVRVEDISAVPAIIADMRRIIRNDARVLPKLHRRVFLDKVNRNELTIYISFYIEAANRDAFMATKQEIFLEFALACERHGAQLASNRHQVQLVPNLQHSGAASLRMLADASLDPDIAPGAAEDDGAAGSEGDDLSSGTEGSEEDFDSTTYYRDREN